MPGVAGPNLGVKFGWIDHENGWGGDMNVNLRGLDDLVHLAVVDKDLATPPGSPTEGQRYIVAASPTGAWVGHTGHIARWFSGGWIFYVPKEGWRAWVSDEDVLYGFNGTSWGTMGGGSGFAVLAGQAGGQTLIGGTAAAEKLILQSTAHATRGLIQFGASSAYDEANVRLGIGTLAPSAGLHVGSTAHASGTSIDAIIDGRLHVGDNSGTFTAGTALSVTHSVVNGGTLAIIKANLAALSGTASSGITLLDVSTTGTLGYSSGSFTLTGLRFAPALSVPSGVTISTMIPVDVNTSLGTASSGFLTSYIGVRSIFRGPISGGPTGTSQYAFYASPSWRANYKPSLVVAYAADKDSVVSYGSGPIAEVAAFYVGSSFAASSAVTTWYGLYIPSITGPGTIWGIYQSGTMNSAIAGKTRFGSTTAPAHWVDIAAGSTTVAFMRAASGSLLTTAAAGCFEYDGTRIYFTDGTPTRQTLAFLSDTSGGGSLTHNLLSATHTDTTAGTVARGDLVTGQTGTPKWTRLALGAAGKYVGSDGTDAGWLDLPPGARSGVTSKEFYTHKLFTESTAPPIDPVLRSNGSDTDYSSTPFTGTVDRVSAAVVDIPNDFGSLSSWKLWWTDSTGTAANVEWKFGVQVLAAAGQADGAKNGNVNTLASPGTNGKIGVDTLDATSFPTMAAGDKVALFLKRQGSSDANNNQVQLLGVELIYTRA